MTLRTSRPLTCAVPGKLSTAAGLLVSISLGPCMSMVVRVSTRPRLLDRSRVGALVRGARLNDRSRWLISVEDLDPSSFTFCSEKVMLLVGAGTTTRALGLANMNFIPWRSRPVRCAGLKFTICTAFDAGPVRLLTRWRKADPFELPMLTMVT